MIVSGSESKQNWGDRTVKKTGKKCLWALVGFLGIAGCVLGSGKIPAMEPIRAMGRELIRTFGVNSDDGQEYSALLSSLLGSPVSREDEQEDLALLENMEQQSAKEELLGDTEQKAGQKTDSDQEKNGEEKKTDSKTDSGKATAAVSHGVRHTSAAVQKLKETLDTQYLWQKFYIVDSTTSVTGKLFPVKELLSRDMTMKKKSGVKQIYIYHTHGGSEYFSNSKSGKISDSIVGVGDVLAEELEKLGYGVIHDRHRYDWINGSLDRSLAYNKSLDALEKTLKENPDIKVVIDLHRDSVGKGKHTYTEINGKKTAVVMFFNGMSRTASGPIGYLYNPNLTGNLAFSLQMKCTAMEYYDGFTKPIYLKGYRYNLHLRERSLLVELGNENNTLEEAKAAAAPLADVLDHVLAGN